MDKILQILERFLLAWLLLLCGLAYWWPAITERVDPFLWTKPHLPLLISVIMFCVGWLLPKDEFIQVAKEWRWVIFGTAIQYTAMPLLGWGMANLFQFDQDLYLGMILVGCVPGAMASNVLTMVAKGNVSYSISLTTLATLLSPLVVPVGLLLFASAKLESDQISFLKVSKNLLQTVVLPVLAGHLISRSLTAVGKKLEGTAKGLANFTIIWVIACVMATARDAVHSLNVMLLVALALTNCLGYLAGWGAGWGVKLDVPKRRALALEVGMQNAGLGATLATVLFPSMPLAVLPPAIYALGCMLTGLLLAQMFARFPLPESPRESSPQVAQ